MSRSVKLPGPIRVVRVDTAGEIPEISSERAAGGEYSGAFVIVEQAGRPIGNFETEFGSAGISAAELKNLIEQHLGDTYSAPEQERPVLNESDLPFISVVIPTAFARADLLSECVAAVCVQAYPEFEVIVSDNRPNASAERAAAWDQISADPHVRMVAEPLRGCSAARNRGVAAARGSVIAFLDDDAQPAPGWLMAIGRRFALEPETDAVTGLLLPLELETPAQVLFERSGSKVAHHYEQVSMQGASRPGTTATTGPRPRRRFDMTMWYPECPDLPVENCLIYRIGRFGMGANMSYRTEVLRRLGGFDESMGIGTPALAGEDFLFFVRLLFAGGRLTFDPEVAMYHTHLREYDELKYKLYTYGCGYTAFLSALVLDDPRHLIGLARNAAQAIRLFGEKFFAERRALAASGEFPSELSRAEMLGFAAGPWRYAYSRAHTRRARRAIAKVHRFAAAQ